MFLGKGTIFTLVVAAVLVKGSPVNSGDSKSSAQPVLGGLRPVDPNDKEVQRLAKFSLTALKGSLGTSEEPQLVKVVEAHEQVLAGILYSIKLDISIPNGSPKLCIVRVNEQPWKSESPEVIEVACDDKSSS